eukprot:1204010-Pyramimonas_sp.AAC.1
MDRVHRVAVSTDSGTPEGHSARELQLTKISNVADCSRWLEAVILAQGRTCDHNIGNNATSPNARSFFRSVWT